MVGKWREREKAIKLRQKGIGVKQIAKLLHISRSSASIWVRHVKLTAKQKAILKAREIEGGMKGLRTVHKKWKEYHKLHPKIAKGPRWQKREVENFFDTWSADMAYVLGYFASDGCMYRNKRGSYYIGFVSVDPELIAMVKKMMGVNNAIEEYQSPKQNHKRRYTLQIGSKRIYQRLLEIGLTPKKSLTLKFPDIPDKYLPHFVRGYFDGDGCATYGKYKRSDGRNPQYKLAATFTCGSKKFLRQLQKKLCKIGEMGKGCLSPHQPGAYNLAYSLRDARQLYNFMYPTTTVPHLGRKKAKFEEAFAAMVPW